MKVYLSFKISPSVTHFQNTYLIKFLVYLLLYRKSHETYGRILVQLSMFLCASPLLRLCSTLSWPRSEFKPTVVLSHSNHCEFPEPELWTLMLVVTAVIIEIRNRYERSMMSTIYNKGVTANMLSLLWRKVIFQCDLWSAISTHNLT